MSRRQWTVQVREESGWANHHNGDRFVDAIRAYRAATVKWSNNVRLLRGDKVIRMVTTTEQLDLGGEE